MSASVNESVLNLASLPQPQNICVRIKIRETWSNVGPDFEEETEQKHSWKVTENH